MNQNKPRGQNPFMFRNIKYFISLAQKIKIDGT